MGQRIGVPTSSLEAHPQRQLHPPSQPRARELAERRRLQGSGLVIELDRCVQPAKLRVIQSVVRLKSELRLEPFRYLEILEQRDVPVVAPRPAEDVLGLVPQ